MRFPVHVEQSNLHGYITIVSSDEERPPRYYRPGDSKLDSTLGLAMTDVIRQISKKSPRSPTISRVSARKISTPGTGSGMTKQLAGKLAKKSTSSSRPS